MFISCLKDVQKNYVEVTGFKSVTGSSYVVLCLLITQAMSNMLGGYSGRSSYNNDFFNEAIGIALSESGTSTSERYTSLVETVNNLQRNNALFAFNVGAFIEHRSIRS